MKKYITIVMALALLLSFPIDYNLSAKNKSFIVYARPNGKLYRIAVKKNAKPQNLKKALNKLSKGKVDNWINTSPNGKWFIINSDRFDSDCKGWECLALIKGNFKSGKAVRAGGDVIHPEGFSAVASSGNMIVYPAEGITNTIDLWAVSRDTRKSKWNTPVLITGDSTYNFNSQPAISDDGGKVLFDCGDVPYGADGTSICEVGTDGSGFRVVITPEDPPDGLTATGALHHPDYSSDSSIIFEGDWLGEQVWRLPKDSTKPELVNEKFTNDNSPCALSDGRIVSLWLNRPGSKGYHELKIMNSDGSGKQMLLKKIDVADVGIGCGK